MDRIYDSIIEALIFSSDDSLGSAEIINAIKGIDGEDVEITSNDIENVVDELNKKYNEENNSFRIVKIANGYLFATTEEYAKYVGYLSSEKTRRRLSHAALETLSIILYKNEITRSEIDYIHGVNSSFILRNLLVRGLIEKIIDPKDSRRFLYHPTFETLTFMGITSLDQLPNLNEVKNQLQEATKQKEDNE